MTEPEPTTPTRVRRAGDPLVHAHNPVLLRRARRGPGPRGVLRRPGQFGPHPWHDHRGRARAGVVVPGLGGSPAKCSPGLRAPAPRNRPAPSVLSCSWASPSRSSRRFSDWSSSSSAGGRRCRRGAVPVAIVSIVVNASGPGAVRRHLDRLEGGRTPVVTSRVAAARVRHTLGYLSPLWHP